MYGNIIEFLNIFKKSDLIEIEIYDEGNFYELEIDQDIEHSLNPIEGIDFTKHYTLDDYTDIPNEINGIIDQIIDITNKYLKKHNIIIDYYTRDEYLDPWEPELSGQTGIKHVYELEKNEKTKILYNLLKEEKI